MNEQEISELKQLLPKVERFLSILKSALNTEDGVYTITDRVQKLLEESGKPLKAKEIKAVLLNRKRLDEDENDIKRKVTSSLGYLKKVGKVVEEDGSYRMW